MLLSCRHLRKILSFQVFSYLLIIHVWTLNLCAMIQNLFMRHPVSLLVCVVKKRLKMSFIQENVYLVLSSVLSYGLSWIMNGMVFSIYTCPNEKFVSHTNKKIKCCCHQLSKTSFRLHIPVAHLESLEMANYEVGNSLLWSL